jgi:WD40 repeat protein
MERPKLSIDERFSSERTFVSTPRDYVVKYMLRILEGRTSVVYSLAFSPDGKLIASVSANKKLSSGILRRDLRKVRAMATQVRSIALHSHQTGSL